MNRRSFFAAATAGLSALFIPLPKMAKAAARPMLHIDRLNPYPELACLRPKSKYDEALLQSIRERHTYLKGALARADRIAAIERESKGL